MTFLAAPRLGDEFRCEFFQPVGLFVDFAILVPALARHEWHGQVKENRDALARISARELDGLRREIVVACNARSVSLRPAIIKQRNNLPACGHHRDYLGTVPKTVPSCSHVLGFKQVMIVLDYSVEQCKTGRQIE